MDVLMPQLGETVAEGKIVKWFKSAGDVVKPGDNLFEIETDKTSMEVPATFGGTLSEIRFNVGEVAKVGAVVAVIAGAGGAHASAQPLIAPAAGNPPEPPLAPAARPAQGAAVVQAPAEDQGQAALTRQDLDTRLRGNERTASSFAYPDMDPFREVRTPPRNFGSARLAGGGTVTPLARRLAGERGIDLAIIRGSGPHGRIVAADVEKAEPSRGSAMPTGATAAAVKALFENAAYEEIPLDAMRATIARRLVEAKQTVPHFYLTADIETGRLLTMREEFNAAAPNGKDGKPVFKLSLNDFIIKAWAAALVRVPAANAVWAEDRILRFTHVDIAVAVALEGGLITPVVREADVKPMTVISAEMRDLADRGRARKLKPNEYQGGASAISNLGMYGVREFAAIINPPHATILAVGATRRAPVETDDGIAFVSQMSVTLSCDHRVIDGALGAELIGAFKTLIENPVMMVV